MPREIQNERAVDAELIMFRPNRFIANIKTPHLIQSQTRVQTSKVLVTRASEVFCCPADALFCQQQGWRRSLPCMA